MWRKIFGATLYCLKKIIAVPAMLIGYAVKLGTAMITGVKELMDAAVEKMRSSEVTEEAKRLTKLAVVNSFFMFIGGLVCCFLFPEDAKGDLTWFRRMITTAMDWASILVMGVRDKLVLAAYKFKENYVT